MNIFDGRKAFYQWDTNQKIRLDAPCQELHIGRGGDETTIDVKVLDSGGDYYAEVPDEILQDAAPFIAYGYVTTPDGNYTRMQQRFSVIAREKPAGYIYTPAERLTWAQLQAQIGDLSNLTTEDKTNLVAAINEAAKSGGGGSGGGKDGTGIKSITYKGEDESGGNMYTVLLTDGTSYDITAPKGAKGDKGDRGAAGAAGAPGIVISSEEPTDPNHPVWIDPEGDETPDNPLGITGATVGQIAKIAAVDASGVPTAWSPVDMPTGVDEEWRKVIDAEVTEPTAEFIADGLNGATELHIAWSALQNDSTMNSGLSVKINNIRVGTYQTAALVQKNGSVIYGWTHLKFDGLHWMLCKSAGALTADNITQSTAYTIYNLIANVGAANTIGFGVPSQQYAPITGKLEVWAR